MWGLLWVIGVEYLYLKVSYVDVDEQIGVELVVCQLLVVSGEDEIVWCNDQWYIVWLCLVLLCFEEW